MVGSERQMVVLIVLHSRDLAEDGQMKLMLGWTTSSRLVECAIQKVIRDKIYQ